MSLINRQIAPNFSTPYMQQFQATGGGGGGMGGASIPSGGGSEMGQINPALLEMLARGGGGLNAEQMAEASAPIQSGIQDTLGAASLPVGQGGNTDWLRGLLGMLGGGV